MSLPSGPQRTETCHVCTQAGRPSEIVYAVNTIWCPVCATEWLQPKEVKSCDQCGWNASHWRWRKQSWCTGCLIEKRPVREPKR